MSVMVGVRNTDLGLLPYDWSVDELGTLRPFVTSGSRGWARYYADRGASFIRITNLSRETIYLDLTDLKLVNLPPGDREAPRRRLQAGDLLISITADIGIIGYVDSRVPQPAYINQHIALVRYARTVTDTKFLAYFLASERPQRAFRAATDQGAKAGMNLAGVLRIKAAFPPLHEQEAIAAALANVDALVGGLDRLIAKKRDLRQATMQQILTGKRRLPGFRGEWAVKKLGDVLRVRHGKSQHGIVATDGKFPVLATGGEIGRTNEYLWDKPSVLIGRKGTIDVPQYITTPFWTIDTLFFTEIFDSAVPQFMFYQFCTINWRSYNEASGVPSLNASTIESIEFSCPHLEEQRAIAAVLSDMDAELTALEQRRAKTYAIKQGMMQELLSGRIRLV